MKMQTALADRMTALLLTAVSLANLLFLAAFLATLLLLAGKAQAQAPACTGTNLIAEMAASDPALLDRIRAEAARTPNGSGRLWKIEREGQEPSYLFGTMHVSDPRVVTLPPSAQAAFDASQTVVIETTDILDQATMLAGLMAKPELMMFTDSTTLTSLLSPEDAATVEEGLAKRGIPLASVIKMKPWMLTSMVSLPACELARKAAGQPVLDVNLAREAKAAGKQLVGLETAASQIEAMASLPLEFHIRGLVETLKLGERMDDVIETMLSLYLEGETGLFWPFFREVLPNGGGEEGYADFEETMVLARNETMTEEALPILDQGGAFIAVGALHLPGERGMVELLRAQGYTLVRAD